MTVTITRERPDTADAMALIAELEDYLTPLYPRETQYGLSSGQLIKEGVAFFITRQDEAAAGCGGLKIFDGEYAEIKRMYVRPQYRGKGLGRLMLRHLEDYAIEQGTTVLRLETGTLQPEATGLYERMGYVRIPAFGQYKKG